jgi:hypothetical protein
MRISHVCDNMYDEANIRVVISIAENTDITDLSLSRGAAPSGSFRVHESKLVNDLPGQPPFSRNESFPSTPKSGPTPDSLLTDRVHPASPLIPGCRILPFIYRNPIQTRKTISRACPTRTPVALRTWQPMASSFLLVPRPALDRLRCLRGLRMSLISCSSSRRSSSFTMP